MNDSQKVKSLVFGITDKDVTEFKFEYGNVRTANVFSRFEICQMFKRLFVKVNSGKNACSRTDFMYIKQIASTTITNKSVMHVAANSHPNPMRFQLRLY